jgi:hypothetical protein
MAFGHLSLDARLFIGCHYLPLPGPEQVVHPLLNRICLGHEQIGASREFNKPVEGTGITCEDDYATRSVDTIGIDLYFPAAGPLWKAKWVFSITVTLKLASW